MKKWMMLPLMLAAAMLLMAGCAGNTPNVTTTVRPDAQATTGATPTEDVPSPAMTIEPTVSPKATVQAQADPAKDGRTAEKIADAVERISEVDDAEVVLRDGRVLVGVEFDDAYSVGLDDRMKQMIEGKVREIEPAVSDIRITDDGTVYGQIKGMAEKAANATGLDAIAEDFSGLWDRITGA